ncbi:rnase h domain-containing protein [Citrus sinensis]|uniref:Rnase h domain-containing protein n=1 Tax=Citrus sinensis TaxID=2711 RepID=A0ACB8HYE6_CITSI|nr:rnase h domain-containing protein [Citrus sinensis]
MMNSFWWGSKRSGGSGGINWMKWERLCKPKDFGGIGFKQLHIFNVAILGFNPSFVWRSIMAAKDIVVKGSRIQIGSGQQVLIGNDPWLPNSECGFITTELHEEIKMAPVCNLMVPDQRRWDYDAVTDLFNPRDRDLILQIPLSTRRDLDLWYWLADPRGVFSVRSCYKLMTYDDNNCSSSVWRLKNLLWRAANNVLPTTDNLRNRKIQVLPLCSVYESSSVHGAVCWKRPHVGWVKCNVDAAVFSSQAMVGLGCVVRNSEGIFLTAKCDRFLGSFGAREAEAFGVREALSWLKKLQFPRVIIEIDCLQVFKALTENHSSPNGFGLIIEECRFLA